MLTCPTCHAEREADDRWCSKCGARLVANPKASRWLVLGWVSHLIGQLAAAVYRRFRYTAIALVGSLVIVPVMHDWHSNGTFWQASPAPGAIHVTGRASVVAGDSLEIRGQRILLWGVDAPESAQLCTRDGKPWACGRDAAIALTNWLGVRTVECNERTRDQDRRVVAVCRTAGIDVSAWLVDNGWGMAFRRYSGDYVAREERAKEARRGIWAGEFQPPWDWRADHEGERPASPNSP